MVGSRNQCSLEATLADPKDTDSSELSQASREIEGFIERFQLSL